MKSRNDPKPGRKRRLRSVHQPEPRAPSWRHAVREASDPRSLRAALPRLAAAPADLLIGPEPPALPGGGRFGWLRRYRVPVLWLAAILAFAINTQYLLDNSALPDGLVPLVAAVIALPLALAADRPLLAWRVQIVLAATAPLIVTPRIVSGPPWPPMLIFIALYVLYGVAVRLDLHLLTGVWLVTNAVIFWDYIATGPRPGLGEANVTVIFTTIVIALGYLIGTRRRLQQEVVEGKQRQQEDQARRALLEERARIARELHDIVAHHMSVIAVRTETAPFRIPELPPAAKDDMAETSAIAREALSEMRRLLGVLRGAETNPELAPQPGIDRLDTLIAAVRGAGLAVGVEVTGAERPLPPGVELSAYRIVQEALSNTLRHAPGARATVVVAYQPDCLRVRVHNDAPAVRAARRQPAQPGQGIIGMRERAAMLGGELRAAPTAEGGYLVEGLLPLGDRDRAGPP
jgi:signal transduction histidine kinase